MKVLFTLLLLLFSLPSFSQNDVIKGRVKSLKEQVIKIESKIKEEEYVNDDGTVIKRSYSPINRLIYSAYGEHFTTPNLVLKNAPKNWYYSRFSGYRNYTKTFSKTGKTLSEKWFEDDGKILDTLEYKYDKNDSLVLKTEKRYWTNIEERLYTKSVLDSILYYHISDNEKWSQKLKLIYNDKFKVIRQDFFTDSLYEQSTIFKHNEKGSIIEVSDFKPLEKVTFKKIKKDTNLLDFEGYYTINLEHQYDENNRIIQTNQYKTIERKTKLNSSTYYSYEGNQLIVTRKNFNLNNISVLVSVYKNNFLINERYFYNGSSRFLKSFFYDQNNHLIKAIIKEDNETYNIDFKYKFDRKGNWIKQTKIINGVPTFELIRKIRYY